MTSVPATSNILEARDLSVKVDGRTILDIPQVEVPAGKVLVLIGPNGSGKTTLLLCLSLLLKPTTGEIIYKGKPVTKHDSTTSLRRHFAVAFQEPLLLNSTVWENVTLGLRLRGFAPHETKARAQHWLERFGIAPLAKRQARTLSGGEAQRASLVRAFALQPEVLFLDEPFAAVDTPTRQVLFGDMMSILQETQFTTVMVTHDRSEAQNLAHRIVMLLNGKVVQAGSPREIFSQPVDEEVAKFVGMENTLEGAVVANKDCIVDVDIRGQLVEGVSTSLPGGPVNVFIRPEDITLSLAKSASSARNVFSGVITSLIAAGPLVRVSLDCGFPLVALITRMSADNLGLAAGKTVFASFKATAIHIVSMK